MIVQPTFVGIFAAGLFLSYIAWGIPGVVIAALFLFLLRPGV